MTIIGIILMIIIFIRAFLGFRQDYVWIIKNKVSFKEYWKEMYKTIKKGA